MGCGGCETNDQAQVSRRQFLTYTIGGVAVVVAAAVGIPAAVDFLSPAWKKTTALSSVVARTTDIPVGKPVFVTYELRIPDGWVITTLSKGAWIVTKDGKQFVAYDPRCTHLNCPYSWDDAKKIFHCPCHGGQFDIDGNVIGGPPPRPLDRLPLAIQGNNILLTS